MQANPSSSIELDPETRAIYRRALEVLTRSTFPFLVGGAYALERHTGIQRHTKDFDVFVRPEDCPAVLDELSRDGFRTDLTFPHWLGKAYQGDEFIDVIFSSGNNVCRVDDEWFEHASHMEVLGVLVRVCPPEEMIWSKGFVLERERNDGADIAHLIRAAGHRLDWARLLRRFGPHWRVLLSHLVLFGFIYPSEQSQVPRPVLADLLRRLEADLDSGPSPDRVCQGTLLSRSQYLIDIGSWGYQDARLMPQGNMTAEDIAHWTAAMDK